MNKQQIKTLPELFARQLDALKLPASNDISSDVASGPSAGLDKTSDPAAPIRIAIALSGGLDSSALLHLAHAYAQSLSQQPSPIALFAFHIHHGISPHADAWLAHCERSCLELGIVFEARRVTLDDKSKTGVEDAARKSRYAALGELCRLHGATLLLTAHHQDDQAETVLLQLLRGSGTAGLSGMDTANFAPALLGNAALMMARPLLAQSRQQLAAYVASHQIAFVDDESNHDPRFARNALRHQVMPALAGAFPGYQERFARSAQHAQSAQRLLIELAAQDLAQCQDGDCLDISQLRLLSADRAYNLLRYWFGKRQLRMPSTAWLAQMLAQLLDARADAQLLVTHPDCHVRRHRERLYLAPKLSQLAGMRDEEDADEDGAVAAPTQAFAWHGEAQMPFPDYGGVLHFELAAEGEVALDSSWLRGQKLTINFRKGGERLKLAANRPTKSLKYHYQALDVPAWERTRLPIVSAGQKLLFAAAIGMDCQHLTSAAPEGVRLRWQCTDQAH